ncbi:MAG: helix-turn-helix domain-containing protein [Acidobacteriia bacterium]|nr:helix-turn-helix domain-containing protein [Terriglobia bacterium]
MPSALDLFGKQLKRLRIERHLSQEKLAEMCGFHRNHQGRLERGERVPTFDAMLRLAYALEVKPGELLRLIPVPKKLPPKRKKREE